jgi:hypothetical protein
MFKRYALVSARPESIAAYLPDNYRVIGSVDRETVIGGRDVAGWTLDAQFRRVIGHTDLAKLALAVERDVHRARAADAHTASMPTEQSATLTTV